MMGDGLLKFQIFDATRYFCDQHGIFVIKRPPWNYEEVS